MSYRIQNEITFSFDKENQLPLLEWIWPINGNLDINEISLDLKSEDMDRCIQLLSKHDRGEPINQFIISDNESEIVGSWNKYLLSKVSGIKYEKPLKVGLKNIDLVGALNEFNHISIATLIESVKLDYELELYDTQSIDMQMTTGISLKLEIRSVVPFNIEYPLQHQNVSYQLICKAPYHDSLMWFVTSKEFLIKAHDFGLQLCDDELLGLPEQLTSDDLCLNITDPISLSQYLTNVQFQVMTPSHPLFHKLT